MDLNDKQRSELSYLNTHKYSAPDNTSLEPFDPTLRLLNELPQSRDEKITKAHVRAIFDIFADKQNHPLIDFDIKYSGLDADSDYTQVLNVSQKNKISQTIRRIIEFLYTPEGHEILDELNLIQEDVSLNQIEQVSEDTVNQLESVIKNINKETIEKIKKTAVNLSNEIIDKVNSDAVEEAAWYEAYIEVADDQEKYDLLKIQLDIEKAQSAKHPDLTQVSDLKELFLNTIRFGIYNNNKQMGLKSIAIGAKSKSKSKDNNISPFSFKPAQPNSPSDIKDFTFSKASGGLPDVVLIKPEGGIYFSYANHFTNGSMESDQLERHSALLMEADLCFMNNDPYKFNKFHDAFQFVRDEHGGKNSERGLYNSMIANKGKYQEVASQFTVSSYQNIGEFIALQNLVKNFYSNLEPAQLDEKIKHISQLIQTLPLLGQDLYNNKIKDGDFFEQQWGEIATCQVNSMFVKEKSNRGDNEKNIKNVLSTATSTMATTVKSIFSWADKAQEKLTINSYTKGIKNNKATLSDNDIKLNSELLKNGDDLDLILAFTATTKQNLRMSILEGIFKVLSDSNDPEIRKHIPKVVEEYKDMSEILKLEDDAFLEVVVEKFIAHNDAQEAKVEAEEAKVEAEEAKADAEEAKADAQEAKADAQEAKADAQEAKADAQEAKADAQEAKVEAQEAKVEAEDANARAEEANSKLYKQVIVAIKKQKLEEWIEDELIDIDTIESYIRNEIQKLEEKGMNPDYPDIILSQVAINKLNTYLNSQDPQTDEIVSLMNTIDVYSNITNNKTANQDNNSKKSKSSKFGLE